MSSNVALIKESRVPQILAGTLIPTALGSIFVLARLYTRGILIKTWGADDTLVAIAWVLSIGTAITICLSTKYGLGHHVIDQSPSDLVLFLKTGFALRLLYQLTLWFTKMGICIFYRRVFQDRQSKLYINLIIGFLFLSGIPIVLLVLFECIPIQAVWNLEPGKCISYNVSVYLSAICNIVADIVLMAFAIPRVLPLSMARTQKILLLVVVSLGTLVIAAALVRCILVIRLPLADPTWSGSDGTTWSAVEMQTGLICISAPCTRPLLRQIAPGFLSSMSHTVAGLSSARKGRTTSIYGNGTYFSSRGRGVEAYELHSENDLRFPGQLAGTKTDVFLDGNRYTSRLKDDGNGSQKDILAGSGTVDIVQTVSIAADAVSKRSEVDVTAEEVVAKFEHV